MSQPVSQRDSLSEIPSPFTRLWCGLCVILSIFLVFAVYSSQRIRWLEDFQVNVVQNNRKASLELLRLQNDAYLLAISLQDLVLSRSRYPLHDWQPEFTRIQRDMENAAILEGQFAVDTPASRDVRIQLKGALADFGQTADEVFATSQHGRNEEARDMIRTELEKKRAVISAIVTRLLVLNDDVQAQAADTIDETYENVKLNILLITAVLFLLALGTGLYTLKANRKTFARLHHLAEQLQIQSGQLRRLSWKVIDVQEETLRQVARDLHDEFGQILTAVGVMLSRAGRKANNPDTALLQDLGAVKKIVEDTLEKVRDQSQMFHPGILDDFGIDQTLEWFARQFSQQAGISVYFSGGLTNSVFPPEKAIHLYRIVQEALSNVARHSKATEAWVRLEEQGNWLSLDIRDNGVGFDANGAAGRSPGDGIGLMGMRERTEHLGGTLKLRSVVGKGTVISILVPLKRDLRLQEADKTG